MAWSGVTLFNKGYFDGLLEGFLANALVQPLRNGFYVLRVRQQVGGRSLAEEVAQLRRQLPSGWMQSNTANLVRAIVVQCALGVFKEELLPHLKAYPPTIVQFARQAFGLLASYPLLSIQTRMAVADSDMSYPDLVLGHMMPQQDAKLSDVTDMVQYGAMVVGNFYAGILPFSIYMASQIAADELLLRLIPGSKIFNVVPKHIWMYGVRLAVRLITYPLSTIAMNLQAGRSPNVLQCTKDIYRTRGVFGFWDGCVTELATFPCELARVYIHRRLLLWHMSSQ